jgi:hypothetical protein
MRTQDLLLRFDIPYTHQCDVMMYGTLQQLVIQPYALESCAYSVTITLTMGASAVEQCSPARLANVSNLNNTHTTNIVDIAGFIMLCISNTTMKRAHWRTHVMPDIHVNHTHTVSK